MTNYKINNEFVITSKNRWLAWFFVINNLGFKNPTITRTKQKGVITI